MERRVYFTRVKPEFREAYISAHQNVPQQVMDLYRSAGMTHCSVHLLGDSLVLLIEAEDHDALRAAIATNPIDMEWQAVVAPMKDEADWQPMTSIFSRDFRRE